MKETKIQSNLEEAIKRLYLNQPNIFRFTPETNQTEWNLAHHLANEICSFFPKYDCDLDVSKINLGNRRPDIIFHKRGKKKQNYLVIEMKLDGHPSEINHDIEKIKQYWFAERLSYNFGAVININSDKTFGVRVFKRPLTRPI